MVNIINTIKDNENNIIHISENNVDYLNNENVTGNINWHKRYKHMRMHTALHLLCATIPYGVTGGQIGFDKSRLDFDLKDNTIDKTDTVIKQYSPTLHNFKTNNPNLFIIITGAICLIFIVISDCEKIINILNVMEL